MKKRTEPRKLPDKPHYWTYTDEVAGEHWFRIPFQLTVVKLMREAVKGVDGVSDEDKAERSMNYSCAMIGRCWFHRDLDLETPLSDDLQAYGAAVLEELHEYGYSPHAIYRMAPALLARMKVLVISDEEVQARADFSAEAASGS